MARVSALRSLQHRNFRRYFLGQLISLNGTWMQTVAQAWLVYRLTNSSFMLGLVGFCNLLPVLLLALVGGVAADRFPRRRVLIAVYAAAMLQAAVLAVLTLGGWIQAWHIILLATTLGVVHAFEMPARHSLMAELVPRADLPNAIALNSGVFNIARFLGPAMAGFLVAGYGEGAVFAVNALSFLAILGGLCLIRLADPDQPQVASLRRRLGEGIHFAWREPGIRHALLVLGLLSLTSAAAVVLLPVFAKQVFAGDSRTLGWLFSAAGTGSLLAAVRLAHSREQLSLRRSIGLAGLATGVALLLFSHSGALSLALPVIALVGFSQTTTVASTNTLIQLQVPDRLRGRVMSLFAMIFIGLMPVGNLAAGAMAETLGAPVTVGLLGIACGSGFLLYLFSQLAARRKAAAAVT
jgi:MFS family permease